LRKDISTANLGI